MKRDDILSMSAGRELDALIIDKLEFELDSLNGMGHWVYIRQDQDPSLFRPSENIKDAWEVVEKLKDGYQYFYTGWDYPTATYFAQFIEAIATDDEVGVELREINSIAETAPIAICRAALLAVIKE